MASQDHITIYLQPECCADPDTGRLWCEHDEPEQCEDGKRWTRYVRADLVRAAATDARLLAIDRDYYKNLFDQADKCASEREVTIFAQSREIESLRLQLEQRRDALAEIKALEAELDRSRAEVAQLEAAFRKERFQ